jgi:uncharacterized protein YrrD
MKFKEGANVFTWDGEKVGSMDRVALDPKTKEVTHLVVQKGFLFTTDKVVPVSLIGAATEDRVTLREDAGDLEALPDFEEKHYIPITEAEEPQVSSAGYARPFYWYPPASLNWWRVPGYGYPIPPYVVQIERNIPEGTVALEEGAKVVGIGGEHVGDVEAVLTDPEQDRATHLLISRGLLLKEKKLVPTTWVSTVLEDKVRLAVGSRVLDELPEYRPQA